jgi:hypothetical protein
MASRVKLGEEKKIPDMNFNLKFFINFSISSSKQMNINFTRLCGNDDETKSQHLRKIVFNKLGCTNQTGFDKMFLEETNQVKNKIKEKIKIKHKYQGNDWFSGMIREEIEKELKLAEKNAK